MRVMEETVVRITWDHHENQDVRRREREADRMVGSVVVGGWESVDSLEDEDKEEEERGSGVAGGVGWGGIFFINGVIVRVVRCALLAVVERYRAGCAFIAKFVAVGLKAVMKLVEEHSMHSTLMQMLEKFILSLVCCFISSVMVITKI